MQAQRAVQRGQAFGAGGPPRPRCARTAAAAALAPGARAAAAHAAPAAPQGPTTGRAGANMVAHAAGGVENPSRRELLGGGLGLAGGAAAGLLLAAPAARAELDKIQPMEALKGKDYGKPRMTYPDFTTTPSGLQFKDFKEGAGPPPARGDTVVVDWSGYTIGYYGRPFEARNKAKGGSFTGDDKDFLRFTLGDGSVIPAFEEAVETMRVGGIRRIIVPVELGYPGNDYKRQGPRPTTFSGERALGFVLGNQGMIDKTLLFDIEVVRIDKAS
ncbi:FKBP19 [Scenedesmus sp. PABB004]|nr:FKBP19 [Scenedesmus sp. PABB004]